MGCCASKTSVEGASLTADGDQIHVVVVQMNGEKTRITNITLQSSVFELTERIQHVLGIPRKAQKLLLADSVIAQTNYDAQLQTLGIMRGTELTLIRVQLIPYGKFHGQETLFDMDNRPYELNASLSVTADAASVLVNYRGTKQGSRTYTGRPTPVDRGDQGDVTDEHIYRFTIGSDEDAIEARVRSPPGIPELFIDLNSLAQTRRLKMLPKWIALSESSDSTEP